MTIPVYRHNQVNDDWEVASVYDSDDCGSLGGSAYDESVHSSGSLNDTTSRMQGYLYDGARPRIGYSVPQQQRLHYPPAPLTCPRWEGRYTPEKPSCFIVPPPGVIFPPKDRASPPQDTYWPPMTRQMASSDMPADVGLVEPPSPPPLLLAPSSPPRAPSPLIKRTSPTTTIAHGQPPHATPVTVSSAGTGTKANPHASPIMPPPPRYHDVAHIVPPRLVETGCQAHSSMAMSPRRSGHDVLSPYAQGSGHVSMPRGPRSSEEVTVANGRHGGGGSGGYPSYGPGDRQDVPPPVPSKYEYEHERGYDAGRTRAMKPRMRERRPSIWQRFVRRLSPSGVSVGQT